MPHYKDGTPATVGDTVRGHGYNIKDPETGELAEITGTLLNITEGSTACNVIVGVIEIHEATPGTAEYDLRVARDVGLPWKTEHRFAHLRTEYGQADHFEKV